MKIKEESYVLMNVLFKIDNIFEEKSPTNFSKLIHFFI